eukprot:3830839-Alexandrium_andersonii.AAC.1
MWHVRAGGRRNRASVRQVGVTSLLDGLGRWPRARGPQQMLHAKPKRCSARAAAPGPSVCPSSSSTATGGRQG